MRAYCLGLGLGLVGMLTGCAADWDPSSGSAHHTTPSKQVTGPAVAAMPARHANSVSVPISSTRRSFASLPDRGDLLGYDKTRQPIRKGAYTWHPVELSEVHALRAISGSQLVITAPNGQLIRLDYQRHVEHPDGNWTWIGRGQGDQPGTEAIVTFGEKAAFGSIPYNDGEPLRLVMEAGRAWLMEADRAELARLTRPAAAQPNADYLLPPALPGKRKPQPNSLAAAQVASIAPAGNTVDVLLGYTSAFATRLGGQSQAVTRLTHLIDVTNQAYANSQLDAQVRLVRTLQVDYPDATSNQTALYALTGVECTKQADGSLTCNEVGPPTSLQPLHDAREQYGADLVSLVRNFNDPENGGCGLAWLIGGGQVSIDQGDAYAGMSVVSDSNGSSFPDNSFVCREETLAHELGHNMGEAHDRDTADGEDNVLQSSEYGRYPYSFGYKTDSSTGNFFTVMAYGNPGQTRYRVFSNPLITFCGGFACGVANQADNVRSMSQTIPIIAAFRAASAPPPAALKTKDDVNNDGKSDIVWYHAPSRTLAYWVMNGATVTRSGGQILSGDYSAITTGDFNGDGLADVLSRGPSGDLRIWFGNGESFTGTFVGNYPSGWEVVGTGDIDNDGKSDIAWYHAPSRTLAYWVMNGATVTRSGGQVLSGDYAAISVGDYNGDGLADVLSRGPAGDLRIWVGDGSSFTGATVGTYPSGWAVVGSEDIDNDGKSDIVWYHAPSRTLAYWVMNGTTVVRSGGQVLSGDYDAITVGDYNGDGLGDVLSRGPSGDLRIWIGNSSSFTGMTVADYPNGWEVVGSGEEEIRNDIDNDGKSDIVWYHAPSRTLAYWVMNSTTVTRSGGQVLSGDYEAITTGDYNGDGLADILSKGPSGDLRVWIGNGSTFIGMTAGTYPTGWVVVGSGDIDNDGKSDIVWFHLPSRTLAYWVMNGASVTRSGGQVLSGDYEALSVGDYNGDGIADILSKGPMGDLRIWIGNGSTFTGMTAGTYPGGWTVVGSGDIDNDGKSDIVWYHLPSRTLAYWVMNGATVTRSGGQVLSGDYEAMTIGDYNGDGIVDVLSKGPTGDLRIWIGNGSTFTGATIGTYPSGWSVVK